MKRMKITLEMPLDKLHEFFDNDLHDYLVDMQESEERDKKVKTEPKRETPEQSVRHEPAPTKKEEKELPPRNVPIGKMTKYQWLVLCKIVESKQAVYAYELKHFFPRDNGHQYSIIRSLESKGLIRGDRAKREQSFWATPRGEDCYLRSGKSLVQILEMSKNDPFFSQKGGHGKVNNLKR
jgi:DNA-binding PadR family transcriptional regulator